MLAVRILVSIRNETRAEHLVRQLRPNCDSKLGTGCSCQMTETERQARKLPMRRFGKALLFSPEKSLSSSSRGNEDH